jgi:hypothetical protein
LPTSLKLALRRLGVRAKRERDVSQQMAAADSVLYRAEYTCIGEVVSGPPFWTVKDRVWHPNPKLLRGWPQYLGVGITTREGRKTQLGRWTPLIPSFTVELRIALPWVLSQEMPSMYAT